MDAKSEKLKNIIKQKYKSIRAFSEIVGIPNTTIITALNNGIGGMAVEKVILICDKLNIDVKTFEPLTSMSIESLDSVEEFVIKKYRLLDADGKERIDTMLDMEVAQLKRKDETQSAEKAM
ncbi:helix-turn-helix transcriptional regulator [uncultured Phascolarctobacterium sp.]|uniref:helix-turn-helix domain-containing protein n=1 Tax=uncultured Phascolarctobacterium sp. TaxID=512296 RepID=UPI0025D40F0E|nr:helix-turn-helix transcriptional regulator [uncultured Phascolarctobacterium sp.]